MASGPEVPLIDRMLETQIVNLMNMIAARPEYSEESGRDNGLAEINACLLAIRYAILKHELPKLAIKCREFLESVNPQRN